MPRNQRLSRAARTSSHKSKLATVDLKRRVSTRRRITFIFKSESLAKETEALVRRIKSTMACNSALGTDCLDLGSTPPILATHSQAPAAFRARAATPQLRGAPTSQASTGIKPKKERRTIQSSPTTECQPKHWERYHAATNIHVQTSSSCSRHSAGGSSPMCQQSYRRCKVGSASQNGHDKQLPSPLQASFLQRALARVVQSWGSSCATACQEVASKKSQVGNAFHAQGLKASPCFHMSPRPVRQCEAHQQRNTAGRLFCRHEVRIRASCGLNLSLRDLRKRCGSDLLKVKTQRSLILQPHPPQGVTDRDTKPVTANRSAAT